MSIQLGYACVGCKRLAPDIGDGGYLGAPTLEVAEQTTVGLLEGERMPSFGLFYAGLAAIGLLPHDIERAREFMAEHEGHRLFITGDLDPDAMPDDLRAFEEDENDNIYEDMQSLKAERERRVASREFVEGYFAVSCAACRSELKSTDPDLLKAHEGKTVSQAEARTFVAAWDRAPDDGWNHRLMGIVDPYESFIPELIEFIKAHAKHGLVSRILPAPGGASHYQSRRTL